MLGTLAGRECFDSHASTDAHLDIELVALEQRHANQGRRTRFVNGDSSRFSVPHQRTFVDVKHALAAVSPVARALSDATATPVER